MNDLATIETSIHCLTPDSPPEDIAAVLYKLEFAMRQGKELKAVLEAKMIEKIQETGQPITIGPVVYTIGDPPVTKCLDLRGTLEALFEACEGDVGKVAECLASNGWKHGACQSILPAEKYAGLFETTRPKKLVEGKVVKQLQSFNKEFVR
jgi:hypothetical protein